ncbi:hypothetical protein [Ottowia sp.]|uniref:hypothetical protein n=1 Tax=Ottowia sp. TaxID=1898956 RepID=UPI002B8FDC1E|nr:hypothetical protein [Ottowia sp.]HRN77130.1 hypothetical protein [Ottowia sp.]
MGYHPAPASAVLHAVHLDFPSNILNQHATVESLQRVKNSPGFLYEFNTMQISFGGLVMRQITKITLLSITLALAACTAAPIQNVTEAPVATASGKALTKEQVRGAILRAGAALGWQMRDENADTMVGTLHLRKHTAVVEIPYSTKSYSIKYRSSVNLDEKGGQIHKNYNGWIQNLTRGINAQLSGS